MKFARLRRNAAVVLDNFRDRQLSGTSPTTLRDVAFRRFFLSREEPRLHLHVSHPDGKAKFWNKLEQSASVVLGLPPPAGRQGGGHRPSSPARDSRFLGPPLRSLKSPTSRVIASGYCSAARSFRCRSQNSRGSVRRRSRGTHSYRFIQSVACAAQASHACGEKGGVFDRKDEMQCFSREFRATTPRFTDEALPSIRFG